MCYKKPWYKILEALTKYIKPSSFENAVSYRKFYYKDTIRVIRNSLLKEFAVYLILWLKIIFSKFYCFENFKLENFIWFTLKFALYLKNK